MTAKVIFRYDIRRDVRLLSLARELSVAGAMVRATPAWVPNMAISDRRAAILAADPAAVTAGAIRIEQPAVISILTGFFEQAWNAARPLATIRNWQLPDDTRELNEAELMLLKLLANGMTDETVARHLGISVRTAQRHIAVLMSRLAAFSRFQAGAEAVRRGWLS